MKYSSKKLWKQDHGTISSIHGLLVLIFLCLRKKNKPNKPKIMHIHFKLLLYLHSLQSLLLISSWILFSHPLKSMLWTTTQLMLPILLSFQLWIGYLAMLHQVHRFFIIEFVYDIFHFSLIANNHCEIVIVYMSGCAHSK